MKRWLPKTSIDGAELSIWGTRLVWTYNIVGVPDVHYIYRLRVIQSVW